MSDIKNIAQRFSKQNLGIWFDVANFYKIKEQIFKKDLEELKDAIGYFHLKDFDEADNYVALGEGIINYKRIISDIKQIFKDKDIFLSIETHVRSNPKGATEKSLMALDRLLSEKRVGYGIVGCGQVLEKHGSAVSKNIQSELRAVFDIDKDKIVLASKKFDCEVKNSFGELLADTSIDVVNIRTPNDVHTRQVLETLKSGKHCLCEKPLCLTSKEGEKILKNKFYKNNITVNFQNRFNPAVQQLLKYLGTGVLGKIIFCSVTVRWWRNNKYFEDWHGDLKRVGGMLFNQGAHALDLMLQICGPAKKITKHKRSLRKNTKVDDLFIASVEFKSGTLGTIEVTTYTKSQSCGTSLFIIGSKGSILLGGPSFNKIEFLSLENAPTKNQEDTEVKDSHFRLIKALNKKILLENKKSKLLASAEDGVKVTKFIEQLYN